VQVHIRPENASDRANVERIHRDAFGRDREARLVHELRVTAAYLRELSLIVEADGVPAGHAMLTRIEIQRRGRPAEPTAAVALAPVAVDPAYQRRGLGASLVNGTLERARAMGHRIVVALGPPEFYSALGFLPLGRYGVSPPFEVFGAAWMARELAPGALAFVSGSLSLPAPFDFVLGH